MINSIHPGDCLAWLKTLPNNFADMAVGSPPYPRKALRYGSTQRKMSNEEWIEWMLEITSECVRICKGFCWWVVNGTVRKGYYEPVVEGLIYQAWVKGLHCDRPDIWHKNAAPNRNGRYFSNDWEYVLCFKETEYPYFNWQSIAQPKKFKSGGHFRQRSNSGGERKRGSDYPTKELAYPRDVFRVLVGGGHMGWDKEDSKLASSGQAPFPLGVPMRFINVGCPDNGVVLDPWMGVGSTAVAAKLLGRNYVGAEILENQIQIADQRLERVGEALESGVI